MSGIIFPRLDLSLRNLRRSREIVGVLLAHGFSDLLDRAGVLNILQKQLGVVFRATSKPGDWHLSRSERIRRVCEDLGPTFIKIGQVLSTRTDLVSPEVCKELKKLQSRCPTIPYSEIQLVIREELGQKVESAFSSIDPVPLATASLAQAHKAILKDGSSVVLKVLKPGILDQLHADLGILLELAGLLERHFADLGFSPVDVSKEFAEEVEREIDYISEANATEKLRRYFLDDREISFPKVYRELSTAKVLTLEFVDGLPLADGGAAAISKEARNIAVKAIVRAVFRQCLEFGFFHADPHPGNIFVLKNGTVCFIDCGMIGQVDSITAGQVAKLCHVVVKGDVDACVDALLGLTDSDPRIGRNRSLRTDVSKLVAQFHGGTLETLHVGVILVDFFELLRKHDIRCPSDLVFLIKALSTVESVAEELDPGFDVIGYSQPFLEKVIKRQYGVKAILGRAENALVDYAELAERLPQNINNLLDRFISERFAIHLEHKGLTALTHSIRHMGSYLSQSLIASSVLVGSAILVLADKVGGESGTPTFVGTIGFSFSFFYILILIVGSWRK